MKALIPPPIVLLICAALMWLIDALFPSFHFAFSYSNILLWIFLLAGLTLFTAAVMRFLNSKTTLHPNRKSLSEATTLVTTGVFRYTRNPIYLGMAMMLVAWLIFLENILAVIGVILFVIFITRFQIKPEEEELEKIFGEEYVRYKANVRRWI